jgi:hypothetical protein
MVSTALKNQCLPEQLAFISLSLHCQCQWMSPVVYQSFGFLIRASYETGRSVFQSYFFRVRSIVLSQRRIQYVFTSLIVRVPEHSCRLWRIREKNVLLNQTS